MEAEPQRRRRILVVGAYGLIGAYVLARLQARRVDIVGFGRDIQAASRRFPYAKWIAGDIAAMTKPEDWHTALEGVEAVVNCAELPSAGNWSAADAQVDGTLALYRACADLHIRRVVHVSSLGSAARRQEAIDRVEAGLRALELDWVVLRPGFVLAPSAHGASALARALAAFPGFIPAVHGKSTIQVVAVEDVAEAVARATEPWRNARVALDLVSPDSVTVAEFLRALRGWLGFARAPLLRLPAFLVWPFALLADLLGTLGWQSPLRTSTLRRLKGGVQGDADPAQRILGLKPRDLGAMLAAWPAGVQERWFARLYFLKPLALAGLVIVFVATGILSLAEVDLSNFRVSAGWQPLAITASIAAASIAAIVLGLAAATRRRCRLALRLMVLAAIAYLAALTAFRPELWLDPLGPLVKVVPVALLVLLVSAILDER